MNGLVSIDSFLIVIFIYIDSISQIKLHNLEIVSTILSQIYALYVLPNCSEPSQDHLRLIRILQVSLVELSFRPTLP